MISQFSPLPFGDQFWALSSICQCIAIHSKFPGKMYLYTVATYAQHSVASNIFASRAVFAVLRPISVALTRHQFWAVCDPIIGPVAGALQSQRDALAHRAWLTREQSSIENDVGIQVTHLLVLCHLTDEKLNKTTVNSGNLLFWHRIWTTVRPLLSGLPLSGSLYYPDAISPWFFFFCVQ